MTKTKNIPPTLADAVMRQSFVRPQMVPPALAAKVAKARRFVLDAGASAFLSDLGHASFVTSDTLVSHGKAISVLDMTREMARAPHALTWIEYDAHAFRRRTQEAYLGKFSFINAERADGMTVATSSPTPAPLEETLPRIGWLIEQERETQFLLTAFGAAETGEATMAVPFQYSWTTDDSVPTHAKITPVEMNDAYLATGIHGAAADKIIVVTPTPGTNHSRAVVSHILVEFIGEMRYALALLAAINDIPIGVKHVEAAKGFIAKGRWRRFLDHSVISLVLPKGRDPRKVAQLAVAISRRRAHQVRTHLREDWRNPLTKQCLHEFVSEGNVLTCRFCGGRKFWIKEHERGDATLGYVTHSYDITHEDETLHP